MESTTDFWQKLELGWHQFFSASAPSPATSLQVGGTRQLEVVSERRREREKAEEHKVEGVGEKRQERDRESVKARAKRRVEGNGSGRSRGEKSSRSERTRRNGNEGTRSRAEAQGRRDGSEGRLRERKEQPAVRSARRKKLTRSNSEMFTRSGKAYQNSLGVPTRNPVLEITDLTDEQLRKSKFRRILENSDLIDLEELRKVSWNGVPTELREEVWKLLLGYVPPLKARHASTLEKKRQQYWELAEQTFEVIEDEESLPVYEKKMYQQIAVDVPRINSSIPIFTCQKMQRALFRLLYTWATRHAATGYVQGMSDLLVPFLSAFLRPHVGTDLEQISVESLDGLRDVLKDIEADIYWCLSVFLTSVQDHYTFAQPGIQKLLFTLSVIVKRIDEPLAEHIKKHDVEYIQFAFKWTNCLLIREFTLSGVMRIWDTYLSEGSSFSSLHTYLCAAIILRFKKEMLSLESQELMYYLQHLPLETWTLEDIEALISQAYVFKQQFYEAPSHLYTTSLSALAETYCSKREAERPSKRSVSSEAISSCDINRATCRSDSVDSSPIEAGKKTVDARAREQDGHTRSITSTPETKRSFIVITRTESKKKKQIDNTFAFPNSI